MAEGAPPPPHAGSAGEKKEPPDVAKVPRVVMCVIDVRASATEYQRVSEKRCAHCAETSETSAETTETSAETSAEMTGTSETEVGEERRAQHPRPDQRGHVCLHPACLHLACLPPAAPDEASDATARNRTFEFRPNSHRQISTPTRPPRNSQSVS